MDMYAVYGRKVVADIRKGGVKEGNRQRLINPSIGDESEMY